MKLTKCAVAALAVMAFSGLASASAVDPNITFGFIPFGGTTTYDPNTGDLFGATDLNIPANELVNTIPCTYLGSQNMFGNASNGCAGLTPVAAGSSITFTTGYTLDLTFNSLPTLTWGGGEFFFTALTGEKVETTVGRAEGILVYYTGTFTDLDGNYNSTPASLSLSIAETGTGTANYSATFADPPEPSSTPEPATLSLLGSALIGLGCLRRRKA